jgi:hypothetical protein
MKHRAERRAIVELARLGNPRHTAQLLGVSRLHQTSADY